MKSYVAKNLINSMMFNTLQSFLRLFFQPNTKFNEKIRVVYFYFTAYDHRNLFATLPRSGLHYLQPIIHVAWDLSNGGDGDYYFKNEDWITNTRLFFSLQAKTPLWITEYRSSIRSRQAPIIFNTHTTYNNIVNFQKGKMKIAVLVRNIYDQLESLIFFKEVSVENQYKFLSSSSGVDKSINFYNKWGKFLKKNPDSPLIKYEELNKNPYETTLSLSDFWNLSLSEASIKEAVKKCTKEEMLKKIPKEERTKNRRISVRPRGVFSDESFEFIESKLKKQLQYPLGYDFI